MHSAHLPLTSTVLVAEVREAPHVAQADDRAGDRKDKLYLVAPLAPLLHLLLRWGQQVLGLAGAIGKACSGSVSCRTDKEESRGGLQQLIEAGCCMKCCFSLLPSVTVRIPLSKVQDTKQFQLQSRRQWSKIVHR